MFMYLLPYKASGISNATLASHPISQSAPKHTIPESLHSRPDTRVSGDSPSARKCDLWQSYWQKMA